MRKLTTIILILCLTTLVSGQFFAPNQKPCLGLQVNWGHPLARGLVGLWLFNEGSGGQVFDLSGNNKKGIFGGHTAWISDKDGLALIFDGDGDYVDVGDLGIDTTKPFTVIVKVKRQNADGTYAGVVSTAKSTDETGYALVFKDVGTSTVPSFFSGNSVAWNYVDADSSCVQGEYITMAGVYDGSTKHLYINGVKQAATATVGITSSNSALKFGLYYSNLQTSLELNGNISYVCHYNRALLASEVALRYREPFCMFDQGIPVSQMYDYGAPPGVVVTPYYYRGAIFIPIFGLWYYLRRQRCAA